MKVSRHCGRTVMFSVSVWRSEMTGPAAAVQVEGHYTLKDRRPRSFCHESCYECAGRPAYGSCWHFTADYACLGRAAVVSVSFSSLVKFFLAKSSPLFSNLCGCSLKLYAKSAVHYCGQWQTTVIMNCLELGNNTVIYSFINVTTYAFVSPPRIQ